MCIVEKAVQQLYWGDGQKAIEYMPDNAYDVAIVDPPYFSGPEKRGHYGSSISAKKVKRITYPKSEKWQIPPPEYFEKLFRISTHQIIWGCNYFPVVYPSAGRIIWDKVNGDSSFSDCEIAYCSFHNSVRMFRYMWNGMMQGKSIAEGHIQQGNKKLNEKRIHPTQKPLRLYKWLLSEYCIPLQEKLGRPIRILDTHAGSFNIGIACYDLDLNLDAWVINKTHVKNASKNYRLHCSQSTINFNYYINNHD